MSRCSYLASPKATIEVLERFGLSMKKSLGQNFLINDSIIEKIINLSNISDSDSVLEVGPGIGTLTCAMLDKGAKVSSVERDVRLYDVLPETLEMWKQSFALIKKDALDLTINDLKDAAITASAPLPNKFVANLPYAVAATLILKYFQEFEFIESATVMVQHEVAQRICSSIGSKNYGAYTVKLSMYCQPEGSFLVGPNNFMPAPHVDSEVIHLVRSAATDSCGNALNAYQIAAVCTMADASFASRRKTIYNSCKSYFSAGSNGVSLAPDEILNLLEQSNIDPKRRGETLTKDEFIALGLNYFAIKSKSV